MKKTMKIITILLLISTIVMVTMPVFADGPKTLIDDINTKGQVDSDNSGALVAAAGKVVSLIRTFAVIAGVVIIVFLGVKFMMGSVEEKAEYKKSFIPLIVGIVVVMAASQIATMLFGIITPQ